MTSVAGWILEAVGIGDDVDPHTRVTLRAIANAVVPETPDLADELGPEHVPGGVAIVLEDFAITYNQRVRLDRDRGYRVDRFGSSHPGGQGATLGEWSCLRVWSRR